MIAEALQALFIVMSFMGLGVGIGMVDFDRPAIPRHLNCKEAHCGTNDGRLLLPTDPAHLFQQPFLVVGKPDFRSIGHVTSNNVPDLSPVCPQQSTPNSASSEAKHFTGEENRVTSDAKKQPQGVRVWVVRKPRGEIPPVIPGHTMGHIACRACEDAREELTSEENFQTLPFEQAAELWRQSRKPYLKERSYEMYAVYIKALAPFFSMPLNEIHNGTLRSYQNWRMESAGPSAINHELNTVAQVLNRAGLWAALKDHYEPLPLPKWTPPRVMTEEEEERLFRVATSNPLWEVAYYAAILTSNTTASGCELRGLRVRHVDLQESILYVPSDSVKNEFRARVIPLNEWALFAAKGIYERYQAICRKQHIQPSPDHYIFPYRVKKSLYDPSRPTKGWRTAWEQIRTSAELYWLRPHDLRHQAITKLLERPEVSEETVMSIAGHVSKQMLHHYSHVRIAAKREALLALRMPKRS